MGHIYDDDEEYYGAPLPLEKAVAFLTGHGSADPASVKAQMMPPSTRRELQDLHDGQIDLLLKFELLRQESAAGSSRPLKALYARVEQYGLPGDLAKPKRQTKTYSEIAEEVGDITEAIARKHPDAPAFAPLDPAVYQERGISCAQVVTLLENLRMDTVLSEFLKAPGERHHKPLFTQLQEAEGNRRVVESNRLPDIDSGDVNQMPDALRRSAILVFARHLLSLARKEGIGIVPENFALNERRDGLVIKSTVFTGGMLEAAMASLKEMALTRHTLNIHVRPLEKTEASRSHPALIEFEGSALTDLQFLKDMRETLRKGQENLR